MHVHVPADQIVEGIVAARTEARERIDRAAAVAEEVAGIDSDLQVCGDSLQRAQLKVALHYAAVASYVAEQRAIRAEFQLRLQEHFLESAHDIMLRARQVDAERSKMAGLGGGISAGLPNRYGSTQVRQIQRAATKTSLRRCAGKAN